MVSILGKSIAIALKEKRLDYWDFSDKNSWMSKIFRQKPLIANWELTGKQTYSLVHVFFFLQIKWKRTLHTVRMGHLKYIGANWYKCTKSETDI